MPQGAPLTAVRIKAIKPPAEGRADYPDADTPGLCLRVTANDVRTWTLRMRDTTGGLRRITLGECNDKQGLGWARTEAGKKRHAVRHEGYDPKVARAAAIAAKEAKAEADRLTLGVLIGDWRQGRIKENKTVKYVAEAERALRHAFPKAWDRPATALDAKTVKAARDATSAAMANRLVIYGRAAYRWALGEGKVACNPFDGVKVAALVERERVLSDPELLEVWNASLAEAAPFGPIVRLLILTGQRREEVAGMAWSEISEDRTAWTLPGSRTKNKQPHIVPLSELARSQLPKIRGNGLVFPGDGSADPESTRLPVFQGWSNAKERLDATAAKNRGEGGEPMAGFRLHDLRRTCATGLEGLGIAMQVVESVLNHVAGSKRGVARIYQRHQYLAEKRHALDAWGAHVARLVNGQEQASNVVPLAKVA